MILCPSRALRLHSPSVTLRFWPGPRDHLPRPSPHTDVAYSKFSTHSAPTPSVCWPTSPGSSVSWRVAARPPADCDTLAWANQQTSPPPGGLQPTLSQTGFELSLGDCHPLPSSCFLCYAQSALEFTLHFYSHPPLIAY